MVAAATMLDLALRILIPRLPPGTRRWIVVTYAIGFAAVVLLINESFTSIVYFYVPALILLLIVVGRQALRGPSTGWTLVTTAIILSALAALLQQLRVSIHQVYFDHNAVYHVVQSLALVFLYFGCRRAPEPNV